MLSLSVGFREVICWYDYLVVYALWKATSQFVCRRAAVDVHLSSLIIADTTVVGLYESSGAVLYFLDCFNKFVHVWIPHRGSVLEMRSN